MTPKKFRNLIILFYILFICFIAGSFRAFEYILTDGDLNSYEN